MIDLLRKIRGEKLVIPPHKKYRSKRPLFSMSTMKILRCVIDNPGITANEVVIKAEVSKAHASYSMLQFFNVCILSRENVKTAAGTAHAYSLDVPESTIKHRIAEEKERINSTKIVGRKKEIFGVIESLGQCNASQVSSKVKVCDNNVRVYIKKLVELGLINRVDSKVKGTMYEYTITKVAA